MGVFVDEPIDHIVRLVQADIIQLIQLHGQEDAIYIRDLRAALEGISMASRQAYHERRIIKCARIQTGAEALEVQDMPCDLILLDTYDPAMAGGSGKRFPLELIPKLDKPFFIAGGIDSENVLIILEQVRPYGIDLSSGLETDGHKDRVKVARFMETVRTGHMA